MSNEKMKIAVFGVLLVLLFSGIALSFPKTNINATSDTALGAVNGKIYAAYLDYSSFVAKLKLINVRDGNETVVSDLNWDASHPRFVRNWIIWIETGNDAKRIVWYNISSGEKIMSSNVSKNEKILYSAMNEPTYCIINDKNVKIYLWNGTEFALFKSGEIESGADIYLFEGFNLWYASGSSIYNLNSSTPVATFDGKVVNFVTVDSAIFAIVNTGDGYSVEEYINGTYAVIKNNIDEKPYRLRAVETGGLIYLTYCREVNYGKHDYTAITLLMIKTQEVMNEKDYEQYDNDYYRQSLTAVNNTVYMLYLSYSNRHWVMYVDVFLNGKFQQSMQIKELYSETTSFSIVFVMIGMFSFIFGMIPMDKKRQSRNDIPIRRFISYEPYMFFKSLTIIAGSFSIILVFINVFYEYPDLSHRFFMPMFMITISTFYALGYVIYFVKEFKASSLHKTAYILAISTLLLNTLAIYTFFTQPLYTSSDILFIVGELTFVMIVLIASLTMIGLTGSKNTWLMVIGLLVLSYKIFEDIFEANWSKWDFYPSVGSFYATHGETELTTIFISMVFFSMAAMFILRIPREKFRPVSKWKKEEYIVMLEHTLIVSLLGTISLFLATISMLFIFGIWGIMGLANDSALSAIIGIVVGLSIFMAMIGRKGANMAAELNNEMFLKPSKKMTPPVLYPVAISMSGLFTGMFVGILALPFFVWGVYETFRAYNIIREKIENNFTPISDIEYEEARKEEEITEVIIDKNIMKEFIKKTATMEVKTVIGITVMLLFLWKFISYAKSISGEGSPASWINYALLLIAFLPLISPLLFNNAIKKSKNIKDLLKKTGQGEWFIAIGIINIILVGFANASSYIVILSLGTSLLSMIFVYRYRTTTMLQKIDTFNDEDMKIDKTVYQYIQSYLYKNKKTDMEIFKDSGYDIGESAFEEYQKKQFWEFRNEEGRGELLAIEPEEYRSRRERSLKKMILSIWLFAIIVPVVMFFILCYPKIYDAILFALFYSIFCFIAIYSIYEMYNNRLAPIKIYENGIEMQNGFGITAFFHYRGFSGSVIRRGNKILLRMVRKIGMIPRGVVLVQLWPEVEDILPQILQKMDGEGIYAKIDIVNEDKYNDVYSKIFLYVFLGLTLFVLFSVIPVIDLGLGFILASILSALVFSNSASISIRVPMRVYGKKPEIKRSYVILAVAVIFSLLVAGYVFPFNIVSTYHSHNDIPSSGLDIISANITEEIIEVNKSIGFTGNILLKNVILNVSEPNVGIYILNGSNVVMENVKIQGNEWSFESYGILIARNSTFINIWGDKNILNQQGGMEIYNDAKFFNCTFLNATTNAIMVYETHLYIENSKILNTGDEGVEGTYADITVENTQFINTTWAITTFNSKLSVNGSAFINCTHGITLSDSSTGIIENSKFENCYIAMEISYASTVQTSNTHFSNVNTILLDKSRSLNAACLTLATPMVMVFVATGYLRLKRGYKNLEL